MTSFNETNKDSDLAYREIEHNLNFYKYVGSKNPVLREFRSFRKFRERTKVFLIDLPFYWVNMAVAYEMVKRLKNNWPLDNMKVPEKVVIFGCTSTSTYWCRYPAFSNSNS